MKNSTGIWKKAFVLTLVGGLGFWLANFAISRTAIAAEYRAAMSISMFSPTFSEKQKKNIENGDCITNS